ncbi:FHA domain containing protein [Pirellula staleyi DSM 6068]|uniref:FHA domain containing protein n=1 Tax=Pirellula staleyi (strain ATCC 27377 / DSM 6068 / ICPB 4128) TaxID=530564 RepID=D2QYC1_PIRSD|nr:FHA domain-containing protein [Pirellula staleyi]ADB16335.1 FHA domain containing protein [Pirellula staleyi DSM 6068]
MKGGITLRVLDGADRGREYQNLIPPITIGREEGNTIQLNDERVSRYHVKIQEDHNRLVITDLESTNGTKVNGEDVQLRILRYGDMIGIGRSVLLFGSRDQIAERLSRLRGGDHDAGATVDPEQAQKAVDASSLDFELSWNEDGDLQATLHALEPPELPERMSPGQAAQLAEILEFFHIRMRNLIGSVKVDPKSGRVPLDMRQWQAIIDLQARLSEYLRQVGNQ